MAQNQKHRKNINGALVRNGHRKGCIRNFLKRNRMKSFRTFLKPSTKQPANKQNWIYDTKPLSKKKRNYYYSKAPNKNAMTNS